MKKIYIRYLLFLFVGITTFSCDTFENDELPEGLKDPIQTEGDQQTILAGTPSIINLLGNDFVGTEATLTLSSSPTKGTAKIMGNGRVLYIPNSDFNSGKDFFDYEIINSTVSKKGTVEITVTQDSSAIPCQNGVLTDFADYDLGANYTELEIDALANDSFCNGQTNESTLAVALQGQYGSVSVRNGNLVYSPSIASQSTPVTDYIVYTVNSDLGAVGVGLLVVNIENNGDPCAVGAIPSFNDNDNIRVDSDAGPTKFNVFENDDICLANMDITSLKIIKSYGSVFLEDGTRQNIGTVELARDVNNDLNDFSFIYTPDANYSGFFTIEYEICDLEGNCYTIDNGGGVVDFANRCKLIATKDNLTYSLANTRNCIVDFSEDFKDTYSISDGYFVIDITDDLIGNDDLCGLIVDTNQGGILTSENTVSPLLLFLNINGPDPQTRIISHNRKSYFVLSPYFISNSIGEQVDFFYFLFAYSDRVNQNSWDGFGYVSNIVSDSNITITE